MVCVLMLVDLDFVFVFIIVFYYCDFVEICIDLLVVKNVRGIIIFWFVVFWGMWLVIVNGVIRCVNGFCLDY